MKVNFSSLFLSFFSWCCALVFMLIFLLMIGEVFLEGWRGLSFDFLTQFPKDAGRAGGIFPVIVSTVLIIAVCFVTTLPIGLGTAILLSESLKRKSKMASLIRTSLDVLSGVPSIVFGLFGNAFFSNLLGLKFSILSGGLTLSCMVLPLFIRLTEESIRNVPDDLRLQSTALGLSQKSTLSKIILPVALPGMTVAFILSLGRALAETAALIFTSGYVDRLPESLLDSGRFVTLHIYDLAMNVPGGNTNAYQTACVLLSLLLVINVSAQWIASYWNQKRILWN